MPTKRVGFSATLNPTEKVRNKNNLKPELKIMRQQTA